MWVAFETFPIFKAHILYSYTIRQMSNHVALVAGGRRRCSGGVLTVLGLILL